MLKVREEFYRKWYKSNDKQTEEIKMESMNIEVICVNTSEIMKTIKKISRAKVGDADG